MEAGLAEEAGDGSGVPGLAPRVDVLESPEVVVQGVPHHHLALQELEDLWAKTRVRKAPQAGWRGGVRGYTDPSGGRHGEWGDRELQPPTPPKVESRPFYRLLKGSTSGTYKTGLLPATSTGGCEQRLWWWWWGGVPILHTSLFFQPQTSAALPSHPPLPPAPLMAGPSSQIRRPPQDSPIHTFSPAGDSSHFLSTHLALVWSIHTLRSAHCKHAGTTFDFTDDIQWKLSTQAGHWVKSAERCLGLETHQTRPPTQSVFRIVSAPPLCRTLLLSL